MNEIERYLALANSTKGRSVKKETANPVDTESVPENNDNTNQNTDIEPVATDQQEDTANSIPDDTQSESQEISEEERQMMAIAIGNAKSEERDRMIQEAVDASVNHVMETHYGNESSSTPSNEPIPEPEPETEHNIQSVEEAFQGESENRSIDNDIDVKINNTMTSFGMETTTRFRGAEWFDKITKLDITLIGLGGIGSNVFYQLSRMHPNRIFLYDSDTVSNVNLAGQMYSNKEIGILKARACSDLAMSFSNYRCSVVNAEMFSPSSTLTKITVCGLDNMKSRKCVYEVWKALVYSVAESERKDFLFIDGRMSAEELQVFSFTGDDEYNMTRYETDWLFSDSEAENTLCSYKQTTFCACMIGAIINNIIVNYCCRYDGSVTRAFPFFTWYNAETMTLNKEI